MNISPICPSEPTVRAELMEQVPHIAIFCQENKPSIPYAFSKYLLPIVVRYLADPNNQVRGWQTEMNWKHAGVLSQWFPMPLQCGCCVVKIILTFLIRNDAVCEGVVQVVAVI